MGRLATRTVARAVSRTGVAVAALMVAVSVTIGVSVMIASFRATVANWLELTLLADVYVGRAVAGRRARRRCRSPPTSRRSWPACPASPRSRRCAWCTWRARSGEVQLAVTDATRTRSASLYRVSEGDAQETWRRVRGGAVLVSEPFAFRHGIPARGGTVTLQTDRGPDRVRGGRRSTTTTRPSRAR